jgi:hypothetical protein
MEGMIQWADAMRIMAAVDNGGQPIPCNITVGELNIKAGTGGRLVSYKGVTLVGAGRSRKNSLKNPNNWMNITRTVMVQGRSRPITIQAILITKFNDQTVYI